MDKDIQDYYETYLDLFSHKGWKQLMEDVATWREKLKATALDGGEETFYLIKGKHQAFTELVVFERRTREAYDEIDDTV